MISKQLLRGALIFRAACDFLTYTLNKYVYLKYNVYFCPVNSLGDNNMELTESGGRCRSSAELIKDRITEMGISKLELAVRTGEHIQTISAILGGHRDIPIPLSIRIDQVLGYEPGTLAKAQTEHQVMLEMMKHPVESVQVKIQTILAKIKRNGGFWSYSGIPQQLDDDTIIESALVHLDLEDLPMLFGIWSRSHIKHVWKDRLVSQGKRLDILNYILAVKLFSIHNPTKYINRYAKF